MNPWDVLLLVATFPASQMITLIVALVASGLTPLHLGAVLVSLAALDSLSPPEVGE